MTEPRHRSTTSPHAESDEEVTVDWPPRITWEEFKSRNEAWRAGWLRFENNRPPCGYYEAACLDKCVWGLKPTCLRHYEATGKAVP